mgnify:CR=1 FL=1
MSTHPSLTIHEWANRAQWALRGARMSGATSVTYDAQKHAFVDLADPGDKSGRRHVPVTVGVSSGTRIETISAAMAPAIAPAASGSARATLTPTNRWARCTVSTAI